MKSVLDRLKDLIDSEEHLAIAITYGTTQQKAQISGRTEQKMDSATRAIEEVKAEQQSKPQQISIYDGTY